MTPVYQFSCIFPSFLHAFVSHLVALALAHVEPLSPLCPVSLSLFSYQISFSPHLIWDDNQPCSCYHSYIWSPPVVVPLGSQLWFPPVASSSSSPPFYPLYEETQEQSPTP